VRLGIDLTESTARTLEFVELEPPICSSLPGDVAGSSAVSILVSTDFFAAFTIV
jgi:hypothetical protein